VTANDLHVVVLSTVSQTDRVQRSHQLAQACRDLGCGVTFVEPVRNVLSRRGGTSLTPPSYFDGIEIISIPQYRIPLLNLPLRPVNITRGSIRRYLKHKLASSFQHGRKAVVIIQNPVHASYVPFEMFDMAAYDCIDDYRVITGDETGETRDFLLALLEQVDAVFVTTAKLEEETHYYLKRQIPVVRVPNGVNPTWFLQNALDRPDPLENARIQPPIVGYIGAMCQWFDAELVLGVARMRPRYSFVLVGPVSEDVREMMMDKPENVHLIGEVSYEEIPAYVNAFSVGMIPFKGGAIADMTDPIKLYEYLILGKPVVATPMAQLEDYVLESLLWIGKTHDEFAAALDHAVKDRSIAHGERRVAIARSHDWKLLAGRIVDSCLQILHARA